jgi:hypothetical protein
MGDRGALRSGRSSRLVTPPPGRLTLGEYLSQTGLGTAVDAVQALVAAFANNKTTVDESSAHAAIDGASSHLTHPHRR